MTAQTRALATVMVVEDDVELIFLMQSILEPEGFEIWSAQNGQAALELLDARGLPDLVLLDIRMPVMNGYEFVDQFRQRYEAHVPIVVMTASERAAIDQKTIQSDGYIGKPFDIDTLIATVRRFVDA